MPALLEMPPMQRRRVDQLGRMALQVAFQVDLPGPTRLPMVFGSRHGDLHRTFQMLDELAQELPLSPTAFGLSTHNAIAAQYAITTGFTGNYSSVAAGRFTAEAAFAEAVASLTEPDSEAVVVLYDKVLPPAYREFADEPGADFAWAARIAHARPGQTRFSLRPGAPTASDPADAMPHSLAVLRYLLSNIASWQISDAQTSWQWQRHD